MNIQEVMTRDVTVVGPDTRIAEIARQMRDHDIGSIPVADNDRLVGMVTDRDIVIRALPDGKDPESMTAREVMSERVLYCFADQDVDEVLDNMADVHVRRLPVVDRDKNLVGIVSLGDLAARGPAPHAGTALHDIAESPADRA